MNDDRNQKYIKEMEKNSKIFEEKMNKFKKYQKSSVYNELDDDLEGDYDYDANKYSVKKRLQDTDNKDNSDEKYSYGMHKNNEPNTNNSLKSKYKKRDEDKYDEYNEEKKIRKNKRKRKLYE